MTRPLTVLLILGLAGGCATRMERYDFRRIVMGVEARVSLYAASDDAARTAAGAAFERMNELDACLSDWTDRSELSRLVAMARERDVTVDGSTDLCAVLKRAEAISRASDGAFDMTIAPVVKLWREARRTGVMPHVDDAVAQVGYERVRVDGRRVSLARGTELDPGGIGKGYALDEALAVLRAAGITRALVDLGGDLAVGASPPGNRGWSITIAAGLAAPVSMVLRDCGVATSGDTAQFVEIDGQRYSHIVDPKTGLGLTHRLAVTVIAPNATDADGLASAASVLGAEHGIALVERWAGAEARVETADPASVVTTTGFPHSD